MKTLILATLASVAMLASVASGPLVAGERGKRSAYAGTWTIDMGERSAGERSTRPRRYTPPSIEVRHFPRGRYDAEGRPNYGYRYYPYSRYRSSIPQDRYDRTQSRQPYPVR